MKKIKIGCCIAYGNNNFGTNLQAYATVKSIKDLGFNPEIIVYKKRLSLLQKINWIVNAIRCGEFTNTLKRIQNKLDLKHNASYALCMKQRTFAVEQFKKKYLYPLFKEYVGYDNLRHSSLNYDAIIVGSDQVWTPISLPSKFFNLLFVEDSVPKIAYASSFGVSTIPKFQQKATGQYLNRFYKIGVREEKGKEIVDTLSCKSATVVADPTLLLSKEDWDKEISDSEFCDCGNYIFCYFLGTNPEAREKAMDLKNKTGLKIITVRHMDEYIPKDENFGDEAPSNVGPLDFIKLISNASYVLTDSFHCSVFSTLYHKKFMTFYRFAQNSSTGRNSRIDSLFDVLGINKKHIYNVD